MNTAVRGAVVALLALCSLTGMSAAATITQVALHPDTTANTLSVAVTLVNGARPARVTLTGRLSAWNPGAKWNYPPLPARILTLGAKEERKVTVGPLRWTPGRASWWWPNVPFRPDYRAQLHNLTLKLQEGTTIQNRTERFGFCTAQEKLASRDIANSAAAQNSSQGFSFNGVSVHLKGISVATSRLAEAELARLPGLQPPSQTCAGWPGAVRNFQRLNVGILGLDAALATPYRLNVCDELGMPVMRESATRKGKNVRALDNEAHPCVFYDIPSEIQENGGFFKQLTLLYPTNGFHAARFALEMRQVRLQQNPALNPADIGGLLTLWPGVIPNLKPPKASSPPPKFDPILNPADPWTNPLIRLIQRSFAPVAVFDREFDAVNLPGNGRGEWPALLPTLPGGKTATRTLVVLNDEFSGQTLQVRGKPVLYGDRRTSLPDIVRAVSVPLGGRLTLALPLPLPTVPKNTRLTLDLIVQKNGVERYRETIGFVVLPANGTASQVTYEGRDDTTSGDWGGKYGKQGFMVPVPQGIATYQPPQGLRLLRGTGLGREDNTPFNPAFEDQQELEMLEPLTIPNDPRLAVRGPGLNERALVVFVGQQKPLYVRVDATDGKPHRLSFYLVDFQRTGQAIDVDIFDLSGNRLETRRVTDFGNGAYLRYRFTGSVVACLTSLTNENPRLFGMFVDPAN